VIAASGFCFVKTGFSYERFMIASFVGSEATTTDS
jgi:hypothetical protein